MKLHNPIFLEIANRIGAKLCRDALWSKNMCNWQGASMEIIGGTGTVVNRFFGPELYNGTSGISLFLCRLYELSNNKIYKQTAEGGIQHALSQSLNIDPAFQIGFYTGLSGIAYSLIISGEILERLDFIEKAINIMIMLTKDDPDKQELDVMAGSAGAIPFLLNMYIRFNQDFLLDLAIRHGEHILKKAKKSELGWSWNTFNISQEFGKQDLTGFSHGTAGIGWALLELFQTTKLEKFREAAMESFRYESHWFNKEHQNWPDFRNSYNKFNVSSEPSYSMAWCHGAPGIGLSRLRAFEITGNSIIKQEAETAIQTTEKALSHSTNLYKINYSLCHGQSGNAELLLYAFKVLGKSEYKVAAEKIGLQGIEEIHNHNNPWPCGVTGGGETPNLMLGLAGIGYFYLRLYNPESVPPVVIILPDNKKTNQKH